MRIDLRTWHSYVTELNLPIHDELVETWEAAHPYQAECMAAMWAAAIKEAVDEDRHNPLQLASLGSFRGLARYPTWTDAVREWIEREAYQDFTEPEGIQPNWSYTPRQKLTAQVKMRDIRGVPQREPERCEPTPDELDQWWGRVFPDTKFNPLDPACELWLANAAQTNQFPRLDLMSIRYNGDIVYHFSNGLRIGVPNEGDAYIIELKG
jgi:hypothetical protein